MTDTPFFIVIIVSTDIIVNAVGAVGVSSEQDVYLRRELYVSRMFI